MKNLILILTTVFFTGFLFSCEDDLEPWEEEEEKNYRPVIEELEVSAKEIYAGESVDLTCFATDKNDDPLEYDWEADWGHGSFDNSSSRSVIWTSPTGATWSSPNCENFVRLTVTVSDGEFSTSESVTIKVVSKTKITVVLIYEDTFTSSDKPDEVQGTKDYLLVRTPSEESTETEYLTFLKFDLRNVQYNLEIVKAEIKIFLGPANYSVSDDLYVYGIDDFWSETNLTYSDMPYYHPDYYINKIENFEFDPYSVQSIDVTEFVQEENGDFCSVMLSAHFDNDIFLGDFYSKESEEGGAALHIEYKNYI